jgi:hypothetical protein
MEEKNFDQWRSVESGNYWRFDPYVADMRWHVAKRADGWYWYTVLWSASTPSVKTSSEVGPFSSWEAAAADCEVAHRPAAR